MTTPQLEARRCTRTGSLLTRHKCARACGNTSPSLPQKPQCAVGVADGEHRRASRAAFRVAQ
jgi:hypothetical protein